MLAFAFALACGLPENDQTVDDADADTDTDADSDADTDTGTAPDCAAMSSGDDWAWDGECPQMVTPCEIVVDGCSVSIGYSSGMTMGMPYSATISGDTIDFENDNSVRGCTGTIEDPDTISGSCRDGCTFTLER